MTSTPHGSEFHCDFGSVREDILIRAYNLCISYPNDDTVIHANDIKSCFRQIKHHPDINGPSHISWMRTYSFTKYKPSEQTSAPLTGKLCAKYKPCLQRGCSMMSPSHKSTTTSWTTFSAVLVLRVLLHTHIYTCSTQCTQSSNN